MVINIVKYNHVLVQVLASMISNKYGSYKGPSKNGSKIFLKNKKIRQTDEHQKTSPESQTQSVSSFWL